MVFPDLYLENPNSGSRYFYGKILDIFQDVVTVETVDSLHFEFEKHSQLWFRRHQVWAWADLNPPIVQLSLF